jgi:hypothetical protein
MEKYDVLPFTQSDLPTLANLSWLSKQPSTLNRVLYKDWPNEKVQKSQGAKVTEAQFAGDNTKGWKLVDKGGEMVGYVALTKIAPGKEKDDGIVAVPEGMAAEVYKAVVNDMKELWRGWENKTFLRS